MFSWYLVIGVILLAYGLCLLVTVIIDSICESTNKRLDELEDRVIAQIRLKDAP